MPGTVRDLENNKAIRILQAAEEGQYGVIASIVYNLEQIVGVVRAAESQRSPLIIQLFPWAIEATDGLLVHAAALAASRASVPVAVHLDHCQDEDLVRRAADTLPFDSIMVDMSHHDKAENLAKTRELVAYCHERGIATEAEPGRIEGGEDGVADTVDMEGVLTTAEEVEEFIATGVDFLAPAVGNVHGSYGPAGPKLDMGRLERIKKQARGRVRLVLHGTNGFPDELTQQCIAAGMSKINVNGLVLDGYTRNLRARASCLSQTQLIEEGVRETLAMQEHQMRVCHSAGKC